MWLPWFYPRHYQSKAKKESQSYKKRRCFKQSPKPRSVQSGEMILLAPKPPDKAVARSPEYSPSSPRIRVYKMGDPSRFYAPPSVAYVTVPNRKNTRSCDCPGCYHQRGGDDLSDVENEIASEPQNYIPDWNFPLSNHQVPIGPAFSIKPDPMENKPHLDPPELDPAFMSYPQVYVCPRSAAHISFPIIDYSINRLRPGTPWPHFYMAIAPKSATIMDLRTTLTPKGSETLLTARSLQGGSIADMSSFSDITDLRCKIIQLEIVDIPEREKSEKRSEKGKAKEKVKPDPFGFPTLFGTRTSGSKHRDGWKKKK